MLLLTVRHPNRVFYFFLFLTLLTLALFARWAQWGFPGAPSACLHGVPCWCETPTTGWVREPYNTWSNVPVFVAALFMAGRARDDRTHDARLHRPLLIAFSYALWIQATGAFFFHAGLTQWSRDLDASSVLCVWGVVVVSSLMRWGVLGPRALPWGVGLTSAFAFIYRGWLGFPIDPVGLSCLITTLLIEFRLARRHRRASWLLRGSLVSLVLAMFFWNMSKPGRPWCAVLPGHAFWHVGMGLTVLLFGLHAARDFARPVR